MLHALARRSKGIVVLMLVAFAPSLALASETGPTSTTDPISQGIVALTIVMLFVLLAREAAHRVLIVLGAAALMWLITYLTPFHLISFERAWAAVDLNVLLLLASMMAVVAVLKATGFFAWAVGTIMNRAQGEPRRVQRLVGWFTAATSAFLDNVTTVIFVTPMATGMGARLGLAPVAILLPMVIASNIGGTATLIGDPPNIMIGSGAHLSFLDFLEVLTAPVIVMMVAIQAYSARYYRAALDGARPPGGAFVPEAPPRPTDPLLLRWMAGICLFILIGFLTHAATGMPPAVPALIGAAAALIVQDVLYLRRHQPTQEERTHGILHVIEHEIEWPTLSFFFFLFIVVGAAVETGLIGTIAHGLESTINGTSRLLALGSAGTLLFAALLICWVSAVLSAFIDNIPYVAVSIPIVLALTRVLPGDTQVLWWALSLGACLGGNGTAVGASANVTTIGLAEREGTRIGFAEFMRFGWPAMMISVGIASAFLALHVLLGEGSARLIGWSVAIPLLIVSAMTSRRSRSAR
ncbi:MAG: SLC13 family permease [Gemmatimonadota bacterium]